MTPRDCQARVRHLLGTCPRWLQRWISQQLLAPGTGNRRPRIRDVAQRLRSEPGFEVAWRLGKLPLDLDSPLTSIPDSMAPASGRPATWEVPPLTTLAQLAAWLGLSPGELDWFADGRGWLPKATHKTLRHYTFRWILKRDGSARLLEIPKGRLKRLQRWILDQLLSAIPVHPAAHGFCRGRSVKTFAAPHVGRCVVLRLDIRDFFPSIARTRLQALFMTAGYPEEVAVRLSGLCTTRAALDVGETLPAMVKPEARYFVMKRYTSPHLPQGAPTSPALANRVAYRLDCRLAGLAEAAGGQYTRYADDLLFSGDSAFARGASRFLIQVGRILLEEGFEPNWRKARIQRQGVSQQAAGLVLNSGLNVPRKEYEMLKAILHNCVRCGPETQNRGGHADFRAHLLGRIAQVQWIHPAKGARLRAVFDQIVWGTP